MADRDSIYITVTYIVLCVIAFISFYAVIYKRERHKKNRYSWIIDTIDSAMTSGKSLRVTFKHKVKDDEYVDIVIDECVATCNNPETGNIHFIEAFDNNLKCLIVPIDRISSIDINEDCVQVYEEQ